MCACIRRSAHPGQATLRVDIDAAELMIGDDHKCMAVCRMRWGREAKYGHIRPSRAIRNDALQPSKQACLWACGPMLIDGSACVCVQACVCTLR